MSDSKDDECSLPKNTIDRIISECLGRGTTVSREAKDAIMVCCIEFIHLVACEGNEVAEKEKKKTIAHEHLLKALDNLGYGEYVKACTCAHEDHMRICKMRPAKQNKLKSSGLTMDQLHIEQMKLFEKAKEAYESMGGEITIDGDAIAENLNKDDDAMAALNEELNKGSVSEMVEGIKFNNEDESGRVGGDEPGSPD